MSYILKTELPAQAGKDISLYMCIDFNRARRLPPEGSGERPKQRTSGGSSGKQMEGAGAGMNTTLKATTHPLLWL